MNTLVLGDLSFQLCRSERRRTLGLTVERDGRLILSAPPHVSEARLVRFVQEKRFWIYQKLTAKELLPHVTPPKEFVNGEGFLYLGRSYRLLLVDELDVPIKLQGGRFQLRRGDVWQGRAHLIRWYIEHGQPWLTRRVERFAGRLGVRPSAVTVQELGYRWGSCGKGGRLYFHWQATLFPPRIIDYIVAHELIHLREPHHTPSFWRTLELTLPDWEQRRRWLAERGPALMA